MEIRSLDVSRWSAYHIEYVRVPSTRTCENLLGRAREQGSVLVHETVKYADSLERSVWVCLD